jgi:hypothetical protein
LTFHLIKHPAQLMFALSCTLLDYEQKTSSLHSPRPCRDTQQA